MRRVLFVDDEPKILRGIENLLFDVYEEWEVVTASSGKEAVALMAASPCELLVTDMRMPGMDGLELLEHARSEYPEMVTCVLSGHAESDAVLTAMVTAHQYMAKPTNGDELLFLLRKVAHVLDTLDIPAARNLLGSGNEVPTRPDLLHRVTQLLRAGASFDRIGEVVETDALVTARVLKVANSVFFRGASPIRTISSAIARMGLTTFETVFTQVSVIRSIPFDELEALERVHDRLVASGALARKIAAGTDWEEQAHLAGMLHDVGRLILMANGFGNQEHGSRELLAAEHAVFGVNHAQVAAHLFMLWGFDLDLIEAVAGHHDLESALVCGPGTRRDTAIACALWEETLEPELVPLHDELIAPQVGLDTLEMWRTQLKRRGAA